MDLHILTSPTMQQKSCFKKVFLSYMAYFYDPFFGMDFLHNNHNSIDYSNITNDICSASTVVVLFAGNSVLCYYVLKSAGGESVSTRPPPPSKDKFLSSAQNSKRVPQFQSIIQVCAISSLVICTATIYVYMQYFYTPSWLTFVASMCYNSSNGKQKRL